MRHAIVMFDTNIGEITCSCGKTEVLPPHCVAIERARAKADPEIKFAERMRGFEKNVERQRRRFEGR